MMLFEAKLLQMTKRLSTYIAECVTLAGTDKREEVFTLFDNIQLLFPHWVIMTCPIMHPDIHYISNNFYSIFGYGQQYKLNNRPETFFQYVHDADKDDLHSCLNFAHDFLEAVPPAEHADYRLLFNYRFKKSNGQYIHLQDEKAALNLHNAGNLYYALFRDLTDERQFTGVKLDVFKQDRVLEKIKEFKPSLNRTALSKREGELVTLIRQGLSTKEIAWYLKISHHTVRNIKSKLFEKLNVSNTVELLNKTA
ncbi:MAG TPA: LuxR C-terminal-related transcriptional regulator [Chitinophagaceae bacterium]|jgi:DNA-binding CsgD family transcriptional regulator|nr:LuxR C-terminal-related transcriptional regulator [Chitinophagaceae bacterium]